MTIHLKREWEQELDWLVRKVRLTLCLSSNKLEQEEELNLTDNFEKFDEHARKSLSLAQAESRRMGHSYVGTEHLLLGLLRMSRGIAARVLASAGVQYFEVCNAMAFIEAQSETAQVQESGLTPGAKQAIVFAMEEAFRLNHSSIGTEHVLLGLLRNGQGSCAGVITAVGIDVDTLRDRTFSVIETWDAESVQAPAMRADHTRRHSIKLRGLRSALDAAHEGGDEAESQSIERDIAINELRWLDAERDRLVKRLIDLERHRLSGDDEIRRVLAQIDWVRSQRRRFVDNRASRIPGPGGAQKTAPESEEDEPEDRR